MQDLQVSGIRYATHFSLCFPKLTGSFKSQCFVGKPLLQAFCSELCFKSWWILLFKSSYGVSFFSGSFVQTSLLVSPFSGANSSTVAEFHLICDPIWDSCPCLLLAQTVHCFLQAPVKAAAAQIPKGILLVMLSLALGAECWAKVIPHMLASKKVTYLPHWCWFCCYYRVFVCRLKYQP